MYADQAVEHVTKEWLARRPSHGPITDVQKGGPGPLVRKTSYSHYKGSRISTDGDTIYSYTTPLLTIVDGKVHPDVYYIEGDYSRTTAKQIAIINRILAERNIEVCK